MNKNLIYIVGAVVLLGAGYMLFFNKPSQPTPQPTPAVTQEQPQETTAAGGGGPKPIELTEQNSSKEMGTATLIEEGGKVKVTLNLTGAPKDIAQPAHIHTGVCPEVGDVKYPLTSPVNGSSETILDVTMEQLKSEMPLAINVHKSPQEAKVYVSCGDLTL